MSDPGVSRTQSWLQSGVFVLPVRKREPSWNADLGLDTPVVDEERRERASFQNSRQLWSQDDFVFLPPPQKSTLSHLLLGEHDIPLTCLEQVVTGICGENITYVNYSIKYLVFVLFRITEC